MGRSARPGGKKDFAPRQAWENPGGRPFPERRPRPKRAAPSGSEDLCWGRNPVLTLLQNRPELCRKVFLLAGAQDEFRDTVTRLCADRRIPLDLTERDDLERLTGGAVHQGVAARVAPIPPADLDDVVNALDPQAPALVVLLDHCQDPHNLGAVIRTAEVAGAACVVCQNDRSATVNGTVVKTSAGAAFRLPVARVINVGRTVERLKHKGFWVVGLDHRTDETVWSSALPERLALVVGSEGDGISALTAKNCDKLVSFPMAGRTGSLNAGVAAALGMFEWVRLYGCGARAPE
ncbi:23S rRNA (guanosine(2251)-2'-O)-methyltransferase RlmB [Pyramidobacter sp. C12-8]|uniref:23S rRNA (guanosine(2251)-2'-O)-methyltransferase RlmB n=1 Tax=Pyramidobacter sp. C12-8 TaxID=1943580 RepID=UPI001F0A395E|nr:23S rRNA (guanosine(2251)-2'-O)-methyltransferase RlmB [Pyramidobacter sp. C12-8]